MIHRINEGVRKSYNRYSLIFYGIDPMIRRVDVQISRYSRR